MWGMAFVATRCAGSLVGMAEWGGGRWVGVCSILAIRVPLPYSQDLWNFFPMSLHSPSFSCVWNPLGREEGEVKSPFSIPFLSAAIQCSSFTVFLVVFLLPPGSPVLFFLLM